MGRDHGHPYIILSTTVLSDIYMLSTIVVSESQTYNIIIRIVINDDRTLCIKIMSTSTLYIQNYFLVSDTMPSSSTIFRYWRS